MSDVLPSDLAQETVETVRRWLRASSETRVDPSAQRLAGVLRDPEGLDFTLGFVDRVVRPEDLRVAARSLEELSRSIPKFLPWYLRAAIATGGGLATGAPWPTVPVARRALRSMVDHLVVDATPAKLGPTLAKLRGPGIRLNLNLLGEAVLGDSESDRRLEGTRALLERDDVDYVSIKVSAVASQLSMWAFEETSDRIVERLLPLFELALASARPTFINLDMEEYRDLDLTIDVFTRLLDRDELLGLEAGIVLQAYLPDSLGALQLLTDWSRSRVSRGGAPIKVRIVKGANLAQERVDAAIHGWPLATWSTKQETDTHYKRLLRWALTQDNASVVKVGVAGHNLFDLAYAWNLAKKNMVTSRMDVEMLLGMASAQAQAVRADVGDLLLYTPVVHPSEFDSAIGYLVRRLEEGASPENFLSSAFDLESDPEAFDREEARFLASLRELDDDVPRPRRTQDRTAPVDLTSPTGDFANEPDTDPALEVNRTWARRILRRSAVSELGVAGIESAWVDDDARLEEIVAGVAEAGVRWGQQEASTRAELLDLVGRSLAARRADLLEVMASETGKTIAEGDPEVSEAIDFAHYYAELARELDRVEGAVAVPPRLTVVAPPWNFPVSIAVGGVLAALAVGSGVILKPAPQAHRTAAVVAEVLWEAGVPRSLLALVDLDEEVLGRSLVTHPAVDRVLLTGSFETAALFRSWRPDLALHAETSGKNAIVVTPSADFDLAVADVVASAFGHAGQKCSAASLVILVGSAGESERFRRQLVDAVRSIRVGYPDVATTRMGPLIDPPGGTLERGLRTLAEGESWLVKPAPLDETDVLWSPGVRDGVRPGSEFHRTEFFGPVLGIMHADTLEQAIAWQNDVDYGLTAGLHSLDESEIALWSSTVTAGNLYVNRSTTGAIVRRQPFGGWKRSRVGTGAKAGGPDHLAALTSWRRVEHEPASSLQLDGVPELAVRIIEATRSVLTFGEFDFVRSGSRSDQRAWEERFGSSRDESGLGVERNVLRHRPHPAVVRLATGGRMADLVRVVAAAARAGAPLTISSAEPLPAQLVQLVRSSTSPVRVDDITVENEGLWLARAEAGLLQGQVAVPAQDPLSLLERATQDSGVLQLGLQNTVALDRAALLAADPETRLDGPGAATYRDLRIRLIGGDASALARAVGGSPDVAVYADEVTEAGRIELLPFLLEQAVSLTAHRFGNPVPELVRLPL
ncbi:Bifunctional protein PutA [Frondihabitans sp. 762G35]|uniref:bifunctional proline dehydrogenase/L-glutamate gamma-semialdehyde dehydrogenase n=1 Tax=Frondihabitans sp. 762G35 TaxID=1446794 RepID=UPI000D21B09F|nr:bifunctional proline dehydrogenase/L-glutamate gamma-semialdehyde dehydrogenase [Frondihabitans sp. 762G35]ARC55587.1 Bifunctional protein PutA [Frondihabitans sp. 762G35]